ncbi:MAG: hypothetical protein ACXWKP_20040 [Bradyrhizobium sp.]
MHILRWASIWLGLLAAATIVDMPKAAAGVILITPEEAKLPAPTRLASTRAITRGPRIEVSNLDDGKLHSPLHFNLKFRAFGGSSIDLDSLSVTYLRGSNVDLTQRVRPYARPTGIDIPDAEVPPGEHAIRVDLKDSEGRAATVNFVLAVTPN